MNSAPPATASPGVKVAASHHAQYNPHAMLRDVVLTVEDVVNSPMISDAAPSRLLRGVGRRRRAGG